MHRLGRVVRGYASGRRMFGADVQPRPLNEMPGPRSLPLLGTLWRYLPGIGKYQFDRLHRNGASKFAQFGPAVREELVPGVIVVWLFDPADVETLFRSGEGRHPCRRSHLALQHFRLSRPHVYNTGGLLPTNGQEWSRLRTSLQRALSRPQNVRAYIDSTDNVLRQFLQLVNTKYANLDASITPPDFLDDLSRLFLELTCLVAFDVRLGALHGISLSPDSRPARLIDAALAANSCILGTDNGPQLWKKMRTPLYRKLENALLYLEEVAVELVENKVAAMKTTVGSREDEQGPASLLEQYIASSELDRKDVVGMAVDMLLAGVDTTTYTSSFALYHLATNPESQQRLREEARNLLPNDEVSCTANTLSQASYTKAVLKETFRLNPVSVGVGRVLQHDTVFSGYLVPSGTVVVTQSQVTSRQPQWFRHPERFLPERWLKGHELAEVINPFVSLPFGHGPRTCIARRLAEQSMQMLLLRIVRDFEISWCGEGELDCRSLLINKPDKPVTLAFKPVSS